MVRAVDETMQSEQTWPFEGVAKSDFDDMFRLRDKLANLKAELSPWLVQNADFLATDILTTIDTTSGYIWMPLVESKLKKDGTRKGIFNCSVSILATTLELRIYMDFGGQAPRELRSSYFKFLESLEYEKYLKTMQVKEGLCVFDIDWFSALFNPRTLEEWSEGKALSINEARQKLAGSPEGNNIPITWNRMLHGYRLSKFEMNDKESISFADIEPRLCEVIRFYQAFNAFRYSN
jgi:hypothetical protein